MAQGEPPVAPVRFAAKIAANVSLKTYHPNHMNIHSTDSQTAVVTGLVELVAANASQVRDEIRAALPATATHSTWICHR